METEHGMRLLRHKRGNPDPDYVEAYPTAPPLDSTTRPQDRVILSAAKNLRWFSGEILRCAQDDMVKFVNLFLNGP